MTFTKRNTIALAILLVALLTLLLFLCVCPTLTTAEAEAPLLIESEYLTGNYRNFGEILSIGRDDINSSATLNWLLIIMAINFVTEGEKILRKLVGAMGSSAEGTAAASRGVKGAFNKGRKYVKRAITGVKEKEEKEQKEDE